MEVYNYVFNDASIPNLDKDVVIEIKELTISGLKDTIELLERFKSSTKNTHVTDFSFSSEGGESIAEVEFHFDEGKKHVISHCVIGEKGKPIRKIKIEEDAYFIE